MKRKNELRKSGIQRWLLLIAGVASIGGLALSEPLAQQPSSPAQATLVSAKVPETTPARATLQPQATNQPQIVQSYGKLPLSFEANQGQTDEQVKFLSRGRGYTLFLTQDEAVLVLREKSQARGIWREAIGKNLSPIAPSPSPAEPTVLRMQFEGANPSPIAHGLEPLPGIVNYFLGNDPEKWRTNIPTYAKVRYKDIYPGIDLAYYGNEGKLEYDLIVAPGADPNQIKLAFQGAEDVRVGAEGHLILQVSGGEISLLKPHVYQEVKGKKQEIVAQYILQTASLPSPLEGEGQGEGSVRSVSIQVGIQVAAYDSNAPLVIDPILSYSTYLGGSSADDGAGIAVDAAGNAYVAGNTYSANFPTASPAQSSISGDRDVFVTKFNAAGSALVYSTYLGGNNTDTAFGIAVDAAGNAYVTGNTISTNFPTTPGAFDTSCGTNGTCNGGSRDGFVTKLNAAGSALMYSTYLGGSDIDEGLGIAVDAAGNAYVTGYTRSSDFPTASPFQGSNNGSPDVFVTKLNAAGSALVYSTYLGGSSSDFGNSIAVDDAGNAYVTGQTNSSNFPIASAVQGAKAPGNAGNDVFVTKLNAAGTALIYSTYLGGGNNDIGQAITVDAAGNAYVTGKTASSDFPTASPLQATHGGPTFGNDAFVTKINTAGSAFVYSTYLGGNSDDSGLGIAVDAAGNAYVTGSTLSTNFPTANPLQSSNTTGGQVPFVTKINGAGSAMLFSTYLNGVGIGSSIATDGAGNAYMTGWTTSTNFPTAGPFQATNGGGQDAFVCKICNDPPGTPGTWTATGSMGTARVVHTATLLPTGKVLVAGGTNSTGAAFASADLYDRTTGAFTGTGSMGTARKSHTATLLPNGKVLVAGGRTNPDVSVASAELYDPATGTWTPTGSMGTARGNFTATRLPNGKVLVAGGLNIVAPGACCAGLASAELYDPATGTFSPTGSLGQGRWGHTATLLPTGNVLIAAGNPGAGFITSAELYDPATGTFTFTGSMAAGRQEPTATLLPNGKVLIAGGGALASGGCCTGALASAELYDPAAGTFTSTGSMGTGRLDHPAVLLSTGKVLVAGGQTSSTPTTGCCSVTNSAELYDPVAATFAPTVSMAAARSGHSMILLPTGEVLTTGGGDGTNTLTSAELYTPVICGPEITSISPTSGSVGTTVTITGSGFGATEGPSTVKFNGVTAASASTWSDTQIVVNVPSGATTGPVIVTVNSIQSNGEKIFTVTAPPAAPTGLSAIGGNAQVTLNWTPSSSTGVTEQRLYRSTTSGSYGSALTTFTNNTTSSYTDSTATNGTTYYYVIRAYNGTESANSNEVSATPTASGGIVSWDGGGGDGLWQTAMNWSGDVLPGPTDDVQIGSGFPTITLSAGTQSIRSLQASSPLTISAGSLTIAHTSQINAALTISGGTLTANGALTAAANLTLSSGTLSGSGNVTLTGTPNTWSGGTMSGAGTTQVANGASLSLTTATKTLGRPLVNAGTVTMTGAGGLNLATGASVTNQAGATWDIQTDVGVALNSGTPTVTNAGLFKKSAGTGTSTIGSGFTFDNNGTVQVTSGTLSLSAGTSGGGSSGTYTVGTGATLSFSSSTQPFTLTTNASITGTGTVNFAAILTLTGTYSVTGPTNISGTLTYNGTSPLPLSSGTFSDGSILGTGTVSITAPAATPYTWSAGTMRGTGTTTVVSGAGLAISTGTAKGLRTSRALINNGTVTLTGANFDINEGASITNNGTFDVQSDAGFVWGIGATPNFLNTGTFTKSGGAGTSTITPPIIFSNSGSVRASSGTIAFNGTYTQSAGLTTLNGGNLSVPSTLNINGGSLTGTGTITGNVSNAGGTVSPGLSPGILNISGIYTQSSTGSLNIELGGTTAGTQYDQLAIVGNAALAGTLNVTLINSFSPSVGDAFLIMTYGSNAGLTDFGTKNLPNPGAGKTMQAAATPTNYAVTTTPTVNQAPTANSQSVTTAEDTAKTITLSGSDPAGNSLTFSIVTGPHNGALGAISAPSCTLGNCTAMVTYTPNANFNGFNKFTFKVNNGTSDSAPATVSITVTPVNDPPTATAQSVSTPEDTAVNISLTGSDPDLDTLKFTVASGPSHGTMSGPNLSFGGLANLAAGREPFSVAVGDLNGDGKLDLAVANADRIAPDGFADTISVFLGNGDGTFTSAPNVVVGTGSTPDSGPVSVKMADLNGDGMPDLVVVNTIANNVSILLGNGDGTFSGPSNFTVGTFPHPAAIGDLNGDGKFDLAVPNVNSNTVSILLGTGTGSFTAQPDVPVGVEPRAVAIGDFNGDGKLDLAVGYSGQNNLTVHLGDGLGGFAAALPTTTFAVGVTAPGAIVPIDVNGDGKADLIIADPANSSIWVLLGTGNSALFQNPTSFAAGPSGSGGHSLAVADVNGDGKLDVVVASHHANVISILLGNGDGTFGAPTTFAVGTEPLGVAVGDFNGDGRADVASANGLSNNASILLNTTFFTYTPAANYNGSDSFTFTAYDGIATSAPATVNMTITPVNDKPTADNKTVTTPSGQSVAITLSGSDVETSPANFTWNVGTPAHGTLSGTPPNLTYTPAANYVGPDGFTYTVTDRGDPDGCTGGPPSCSPPLTSAPATVSITVTPVLTILLAGTGGGSVTISTIPPPNVCPPTCSVSFTSGTSVTLTAAPASNSVAAGFTGGCVSNTNTCTFTITGNTTVTATFDLKPTVTAISQSLLLQRATADITITGTNFQPNAQASFGAAANVTAVRFVNATTVVATVSVPPTGAPGTYKVTVTNLDGGAGTSTASLLTVVADSDGDSVPDAFDLDGNGTISPPSVTNAQGQYETDNCRDVPNPTQSDLNHNGIGDACDPNPTGATARTSAGQVTTTGSTAPPASTGGYLPQEPIFVTATVTFNPMSFDGSTAAQAYFVLPPTPYNVILRLTDSLGHDVPTGKIPEGPPISLPRDLVQLAANTTQSFSTVINLRDWFPTLAPGTYTLTATYVNLVKDPEVTATGTCPTGSTCFTPLWMGAAPAGTPTAIQVQQPASPPPTISGKVVVSPATWDLTWEVQTTAGVIDVFIGNLPAGFDVTQIVAATVLLNGALTPSFSEIRQSVTGFTGAVLHLQYPETPAIQSVHAFVGHRLLIGEQEALSVSGVLKDTSGSVIALLQALSPSVTLQDLTPPTLTVPANITVNATSPSGAVVTYTVSAVDAVDPAPTVSCSKTSGSTFPIGTTTVTCTATDASGNTSSKSFTVTVKGASTQISDLIAKVQGLPGVSASLKNALIVKLQAAQNFLNQGNITSACVSLNDFISLVKAQSGKGLTVAQATDLQADATRVKAVIGCP